MVSKAIQKPGIILSHKISYSCDKRMRNFSFFCRCSCVVCGECSAHMRKVLLRLSAKISMVATGMQALSAQLLCVRQAEEMPLNGLHHFAVSNDCFRYSSLLNCFP